jgi:hypothetical protein
VALSTTSTALLPFDGPPQMTRLSPVLLRGLTVLGLGATIALAHVSFAAAASKDPSAPRPLTMAKADVETTGSVAKGPVLAENCYFERVEVRLPSGKSVMRPVQECD